MKSVLISIQPKWCELIASGKKTVEVRKTRPKLEPPFKVYIYCTQNTPYNPVIPMMYEKEGGNIYIGGKTYSEFLTGKVIGEFVCDDITKILNFGTCFSAEGREKCELNTIARSSCLDFADMRSYFGTTKEGYAWHISDLVIYEEPKRFSEFYNEGDCDCMNCRKCAWFDAGNGYNIEGDCNLAYKGLEMHKSYKPIIRPPQSWCYVERLKGE